MAKQAKAEPTRKQFRNWDDGDDASNLDDDDGTMQPTYSSPEQALKTVFGYNNFRNNTQANCVRTALRRKNDIFVLMPTGAGKSMCYQLPAICDEANKLTVVISPLLALMADQVANLVKLGIVTKTFNSLISQQEREEVLADLKSKNIKTRLLYISPEMADTSHFLQILDRLYNDNILSRVAVDEAHCVSQWGHDFRPAYIKLGNLRKRYPDVPFMALSATANSTVVEDIVSCLHLKNLTKFVISDFRKNLHYDVIYADLFVDVKKELEDFVINEIGSPEMRLCRANASAKRLKMVEELSKQKLTYDDKAVGIIYCLKRETCDEIASHLSTIGIRTQSYHSKLKSTARDKCLKDWTDGKIKCIVATVSFGMGVDKAEVRFVVHWNVPKSLTGYYQESGRAGRDGKPSKCRIYYSLNDRYRLEFILKQEVAKKKSTKTRNIDYHDTNSKSSNPDPVHVLEDFHKMVEYCESADKCRHALLFKEFAVAENNKTMVCGTSCDVCRDPQAAARQLEQFHKRGSSSYSTRMEEVDQEAFCLDKFDDGLVEKACSSRSGGKLDKTSDLDLVQAEFRKRKHTSPKGFVPTSTLCSSSSKAKVSPRSELMDMFI